MVGNILIALLFLAVPVSCVVGGVERYLWFNKNVEVVVSIPASNLDRELSSLIPGLCLEHLASQNIEMKRTTDNKSEMRCSTTKTQMSWWPFIEKKQIDNQLFDSVYEKYKS
ncbi:hypothetical protein ACOMICROBIO_FLGHMIGD_01597 [Vibrio sp. B1FLJ16]|uniref:hypothetical protein n=1 Tax=Vibrio sp. B1FLJ16 TaxID=2751178 RepID=UPI0015F5F250|nr:hypothetical protein [Vibrio sp. B1FLJ16]CAD7806923.1 hypothetical protein ACOMICROBIO_FLGHMIGD_01597 [Vibrio sp. B1FLJ16]CAE6903352.1 hypothetical protein ACOMICROBIO_FLGHMIGD_01597 [Vibrio sp. B1FLJ16]